MLIDLYFQFFRGVLANGSADTAVPVAEDIQVERKENKEPSTPSHGGKSKQVRGAARFAKVEDENEKLLGARFGSHNNIQAVVGWSDLQVHWSIGRQSPVTSRRSMPIVGLFFFLSYQFHTDIRWRHGWLGGDRWPKVESSLASGSTNAKPATTEDTASVELIGATESRNRRVRGVGGLGR
jgi:hypothetical protein